MLKASWKKNTLSFKHPSGTSRGVLKKKESWFIFLENTATGRTGIGECGLLKGLSMEPETGYEERLGEVCNHVNDYAGHFHESLKDYPSIRFGLEMALRDLRHEGNHILFDNDFVKGLKPIPINGLIWMGSLDFMQGQIHEKLRLRFRCIKIKIGAIDFDQELALLKLVRDRHSRQEVELRVDANGAFAPGEAMDKLHRLAEFDLHSIEQPIAAGHWDEMAGLCSRSPVPVALDEELIGINTIDEKKKLLAHIQPQFIILKPSLTGGFQASEEWISEAGAVGVGWWATSALESDIGLNAIAQWAGQFDTDMPQGLGTGGLYTNNFESPLFLKGDLLHNDPEGKWDIDALIKS